MSYLLDKNWFSQNIWNHLTNILETLAFSALSLQIATYDKQQWEQSVEEKVLKVRLGYVLPLIYCYRNDYPWSIEEAFLSDLSTDSWRNALQSELGSYE